jgi:hypothetical protein
MKKYIISSIIALLAIVILGIYLYTKEYCLLDAQNFERKIEKTLITWCTVNKKEVGKFWNRKINIKVKEVKTKLNNSGEFNILCALDISWIEGKLKVSGTPTFHGVAQLVKRDNSIFIENIHFEKVEILGNSKIEDFCNQSLKKCMNSLINASGDQSLCIIKSNWLRKFKIRIDSTGVYAKVK